MLKVHHLNNSRSQRILWLLEELGAPYEIAHYRRMSPVPLAPPELKKIHPLGKSPVITDGDVTIAESGAIVEYILEKYGNGRLRPPQGSRDHVKYIEWMHYAEGSAMLPLMMHLYAGLLGEAAAPLRPRIDGEVANQLSYMEAAIKGRDFFVGQGLTGADVQIAFVLEAADASGLLSAYPALGKYLSAMQARPAYRRAIEKGGPYSLGANRRPAQTS
ncbi:MAG TPA: glutathione S-transferase [Rhizomicrobium sp.]|nr:glutathione S-transferase [Rhizomicrobium sp.]